MSNIIDSIRMSGTTYAISDSGGTKVVEITQSDYDNLPTSAKTANIMYVITDAEPFDVSNYYTKAETSGATELATAFAATQPKLSAGTNITIDANNVISAEGAGGKAIAAGTNISVTTGETADTVSCTLPITINNNKTVVLPNNANNTANGGYNFVGGMYCQITNYNGGAYPDYAFCHGYYNTVTTECEAAFGKYNQTKNASGAQGISGTSIFTIGNGDWTTRRHNALEVMLNGDIYIADTNDTSTSNYYQKPMIKLQDALGGGGIDSGTVQTMIDQSISGKTNQTDFVSHSGNTTMHVTASEKSTWNAKSNFSGSYNDLTDKPTIPTSASQLTNDSGYITSSALDDYTTTATTSALNNVVTAHTANTSIHVSAEQIAAWNAKSDFSGSYNDLTDKPTLFSGSYNDLTDKPTIPSKTSDLTNDSNFATSAYVDTKLSISDFNTYSGTVNTAIGNKANSSDVYTKSQTSGATEISTALNAKLDTTAYTPTDLSNYYQKSETSGATQIADALSGKVDSSSVVTAVTSASTDNEIPTAKAVWEAASGGGKAIEAGRGISITTGATADTVSFNLPISADTDGSVNKLLVGSGNTIGSDTIKNIVIGDNNTTVGGSSSIRIYSGATIIGYNNYVGCNGQQNDNNDWSTAIGRRNKIGGGNTYIIGVDNNFYDADFYGRKKNYSYVIGRGNTSSLSADGNNIFVFGAYNKITKSDEFALGEYNASSNDGTTSGNTFFSIGNGTSNNARHNAFEIRQNGDIYCSDGTNDVKLQDTITATAANTTALGGLKLVKLTQSEYDNLATKDNSTLYVIVN